MTIKREYFGTDGLRAQVGSPVMHPLFLLKLGFAIGSVLCEKTLKKPIVLIGRDTRISGEMLQSALMSGLLSAGCDVILVGVLPTPAIAYLTKKHRVSAGLIISASHNPFEDNGVKCLGPDGMKLSDEWELSVEQRLSSEIIITAHEKIGSVYVMSDAGLQYIEHCQALFPVMSPFRVVLDCANGATSEIAPSIFHAAGSEVVTIHGTPDGMNINERCGATHLESLRAAVVAEEAACGFAFDGDGDRLIMVDHLGEVVDGDELLGIIAFHGEYQGVVGTLMTNLGLEKALEKHHIAFERAAVGDRYVLAALLEKGWVLGGEASGHVINLTYGQTGDGIITGLQILRIMSQTQKSLNELKQEVQKRPQVLINVRVKNPKSFSEKSVIMQAVDAMQTRLGSSGRVLLRASGTESCVRVMVEADDLETTKQCAESLAKTVEQAFE